MYQWHWYANAVLSTKRRVEHKSRGDPCWGLSSPPGRGAWLARVEGAGCRTGTLSGGLGSNIHEWRAGLGVRLGLPIKSFSHFCVCHKSSHQKCSSIGILHCMSPCQPRNPTSLLDCYSQSSSSLPCLNNFVLRRGSRAEPSAKAPARAFFVATRRLATRTDDVLR